MLGRSVWVERRAQRHDRVSEARFDPARWTPSETAALSGSVPSLQRESRHCSRKGLVAALAERRTGRGNHHDDRDEKTASKQRFWRDESTQPWREH